MNRNRITALLLSLALLLTCLCPLGLAESTEDPVLATVNGRQVLKSEVDSYVDMIIAYYSNYGYDLSDEESQGIVRQMAMDTMLQKIFFDEKAAEFHADQLSSEELDALNAQVEANYNSVVEQILSMFGLTPAEDATEEEKASARENAEAIAASYGYDKTTMLTDATENLIMNKVGDELAKDLSVSDEDVMNAFNEHVQADMDQYANDPGAYEINVQYYSVSPYYTPEGFRGVKHILLKVDDELLTKYQDLLARFEEQQNADEAEADETEAPAETAETEAAAETAVTEAPAEAAETEAAAETAVTEAPAEAAETEAAAETAVTEAPAATEEPALVPVTQEEVDAAREAVLASVQDTIDEIMAKYESGTPFADLIAEYGTDPGMESEPYKTDGYSVFADSSIYDPVFTEAAFSVDHVGDISKPYVSSFGVHIVEYTRDVPSGAIELTDEVKATIRDELQETLHNTVINEAYNAWIAQADVQYTEAGAAYQPNLTEDVDDAEALPEASEDDDLEEEDDDDEDDAEETAKP